jgi:RES domain-containing protein
MQRAWRLVKAKHMASAFDGEGARLFGGRWNSVGVPMVYVSQSIALAVLEILVHLEDPKILSAYQVCRVEWKEEWVQVLDVAGLPEHWRDAVAPAALKSIGDEWIRSGSSVVLQVPSAIIPNEVNFLLNPRHPDFSRIVLGAPQDFDFDARLLALPKS